MDEGTMICLRIPVTVALGERTLRGELALPAHAAELRVCIARQREKAIQRRMGGRYAKQGIAALNLQSADALTSGELLRVIDWVRSRRLLQQLPISLLLPSDEAVAALKAAHHRPACVCGVYVLPSRDVTLAHSA
jgi:hypothetical protein